VECDVDCDAVALSDLARERERERFTLTDVEFGGKRNFDFPADCAVLPVFRLFSRVPELRTVGFPCAGFRENQLRGDDASLTTKVVDFARALVGDFRRAPVCRRRGRRLSPAARKRLH